MFHGTRPGWIEVIAGVMFSGKSEELIRRVRRAVIARKQVQVFKSHLDARYAGLYSVTSHDGETAEANPVDSSEEIMRLWRPETEVVAVERPATSASSTVSRPCGTAPRSWSGGGSRTRRDAGTATRSRGRMKIRRRCCRDVMRHPSSVVRRWWRDHG